jgi:hypothetical protein
MYIYGGLMDDHDNKMDLLETKVQTLDDELDQPEIRLRLNNMRILGIFPAP